MKYSVLLLLIVSNFLVAQNQRFTYEYRFIPDSANVSDVKYEIMNLDVLPIFSKFYSYTVYKNDSIAKAQYDKEIATTNSVNVKKSPSQGLVKYTVIKEKPAGKTFFSLQESAIASSKYWTKEKLSGKFFLKFKKLEILNAKKRKPVLRGENGRFGSRRKSLFQMVLTNFPGFRGSS